MPDFNETVTAAKLSFSLLANRNSTLKKVSRTNPSVAKNAEMQRKTQAKALVNFSPLLALLAVLKLKFPSSPEKTDLFTAANATLK